MGCGEIMEWLLFGAIGIGIILLFHAVLLMVVGFVFIGLKHIINFLLGYKAIE